MKDPLAIIAAGMKRTPESYRLWPQTVIDDLAEDGWYLVRFDREVHDPRDEGWTLEHAEYLPPGSHQNCRRERVTMRLYNTNSIIQSGTEWSLQILHHAGDKVLRWGQVDLWCDLGRQLGEHLGFISKERLDIKSEPEAAA